MNSPHLSAAGVNLLFGERRVLSDLSFTLNPGERVLVLGHNGSGKSSLLKVLAGLLRPTRGKIEMRSGKNYVGYTSHEPLLYRDLTPKENLKFFAELIGHSVIELDLAGWKLGLDSDRPVHQLSRGLQARVSLARAFLGNPEILILDEPSTSLDDGGGKHLADKLRAHDGIAVIATHDMALFRGLATRIMVLKEGSLIVDSARSGEQAAVDLYYASNR